MPIDRTGEEFETRPDGTEYFVKIYPRITDSSLWERDSSTILVFVAMIILANKNGTVTAASTRRLAGKLGRPLEEVERALGVLEAPDPDSHSEVEEGRRVIRVKGGWQLVNYNRYRNIDTASTERSRRWRAKKKAEAEATATENNGPATSRNVMQPSRNVPGQKGTAIDLEVEVEVEGDLKDLCERGSPELIPGAKAETKTAKKAKAAEKKYKSDLEAYGVAVVPETKALTTSSEFRRGLIERFGSAYGGDSECLATLQRFENWLQNPGNNWCRGSKVVKQIEGWYKADAHRREGLKARTSKSKAEQREDRNREILAESLSNTGGFDWEAEVKLMEQTLEAEVKLMEQTAGIRKTVTEIKGD